MELWAAIRSLGRSGLRATVERSRRQAQLFASRLRSAGFAELNEVVLNQLLVSFGGTEETRSVTAELQFRGHLLVRWHGVAGPHSNSESQFLRGLRLTRR